MSPKFKVYTLFLCFRYNLFYAVYVPIGEVSFPVLPEMQQKVRGNLYEVRKTHLLDSYHLNRFPYKRIYVYSGNNFKMLDHLFTFCPSDNGPQDK